jgi:hypothetical protein
MWIVRLALRRPYTFVVLAILILVLGRSPLSGRRLDIFPEYQYSGRQHYLDYNGLNAQDERPHRLCNRAYAHNDRRQYRAHRVAVSSMNRGGEGFLPAQS